MDYIILYYRLYNSRAIWDTTMKACAIAILFGLKQFHASAIAKEDAAENKGGADRAHFEPRSPQERPVRRPAGCGNDGTINDSYIGDYEGGNVTVIPSYDGGKSLSLNLIFKYWEKDSVKISAEKIELHALPNGAVFTPKKSYHGAASTVPDDLLEKAYVEEVYLEFSVQPKDVKHIAIVWPEGTVVAKRRPLKIPQVLFDYVGQSTAGAKPNVPPCLYSTEPPSTLKPSQLTVIPVLPPVKALKPENLQGTWVADEAATERNLKAESSLSKEQFGWIVGSTGMMFMLVYEIDDGTIKVGMYDGGGNPLIYRLSSQQKDKGKLVYKAENRKDLEDDPMTVVAMPDGHLKFTSKNPATEYVEFKRVALYPKNKERDKKAAFETVKKMFERLQEVSNKMDR